VILAVDTSLGTALAVVSTGGTVLAERSTPNTLGHAELIGDFLREVTEGHEITHVATGMGPGPFTGLRIGIAAARTYALARGLEIIEVPSHLAAALIHGGTGPFAIFTDARRKEVAVSRFEGEDADGIPKQTAETLLVPRAALDQHLVGISHFEVPEISAVALATIAARAIAAGRTLTGTEPLYLRAPDATLPKDRPAS
jgi:tRNA threonylcarbamoyladenosine biosynthesis protein TsaB